MGKLRYFKFFAAMFAASVLFFACDPQLDDKPDIGQAPTDAQVDFTITPGSNDFNFTIANTSSVTGIATWDLGNGSKASTTDVTGYYPLPGDYTITLTLVTRGGTVKKSKTKIKR